MKKSLLVLLIISLSLLGFSQENQNIQLSKIESESYPVYKTVEKGYNKFVFQQAKKNWPVELFSEDKIYPKILIKKVGLIDEFYTSDLPAYPAYYLSKASTTVITVLDKKIYYYTWSASSGATISYILSSKNPGKYVDEKMALDTYRREIKKNQTGERDVRKEKNAALAAKEKEENTLKGKSIKSIQLKFVDAPEDIGMLTVVSVGIEVHLTNGKVLKTKNLGGKTPYTDFSTSVKGGDYSGGDFKVASDSRKIPTDKIEIQAWSKFDSKVKGNFSHILNYKSNIFYQYQGRGGKNGRGRTSGVSINGSDGGDARSVNVYVENIKVNGQSIHKLTLTNAMTGELLAEAKLHANNRITINAKGGNGGSGERGSSTHSGDGGDGGNGGNGGDVTVSGATQNLLITVMNNGGASGSGGARKESYNTSGSKGSSGIKGSLIK